MVCYQTRAFVIAIVTGECNVLLLRKYVLRFVLFHLVFDNLVWKFISINAALKHSDEQQHHFLRDHHHHRWVKYVDNMKYGFKFFVTSFDLYWTHYKVYIHLPCINTQKKITISHHSRPIIKWPQNTKTVSGIANHFKGERNSNMIYLLWPSQAIHYCNQSVLSIVPDLNIFVFSITIVDLISRSALVRFSLLRASYFYNLMGLRFSFFLVTSILSLWQPLSRVGLLYWY